MGQKVLETLPATHPPVKVLAKGLKKKGSRSSAHKTKGCQMTKILVPKFKD
jgi:hypothetical protein